MKKMVIASKCQYGYNTDYFQMANRLAQKGVEVEVVCFDQRLAKMEAPQNVNVTYVERGPSKLGNYLRNLFSIGSFIVKNKKQLNWVVVSGTIELCGILPLALKFFTPAIHWILDIRTCSVVPNQRKRKVYDFLTWLSSYFFDKTTIISHLTAKRLKISGYEVLPLGADCYVDLKSKTFNNRKLNFLYIGKFDDRRIEDVIGAFKKLDDKLPDDIERRLDIVGFSDNPKVTAKILEALDEKREDGRIIFHGRQSHEVMKPLFQEATIGFSYVPITEFFDVQPPTKTFEYIMNGIICIGTKTKANLEIIGERNGVVTADSEESLLAGIQDVLANMGSYNSVDIARTVEMYKWQSIVDNFYLFLERMDSRSSWAAEVKKDSI